MEGEEGLGVGYRVWRKLSVSLRPSAFPWVSFCVSSRENRFIQQVAIPKVREAGLSRRASSTKTIPPGGSRIGFHPGAVAGMIRTPLPSTLGSWDPRGRVDGQALSQGAGRGGPGPGGRGGPGPGGRSRAG